jgi:hypothetical protein
MLADYFSRFYHMMMRPINLAICMVLVISTIPSQLVAVADSNIPVVESSNVSGSIDLWVDASAGNNGNDGLSPAHAFSTISKAASTAGQGTTIHILPGIYREAIRPTQSGSVAQPIVYRAEGGLNTVIVRGSESSKSLTWQQLDTNLIGLPIGVDPSQIYYTDLSGWNLDGPPRFVVELDDQGNPLTRLPLAREPDWNVVTEWKYTEYWWAADGGSRPETCNPLAFPYPQTQCDLASRSSTQLTDLTNDTYPSGVEAGSLATLGDLTGATLVAVDTVEGHYVYRRTIIAHDKAAGKITVDRACEFDADPANPGLGWGSKYYVEGKPSLLDSPGEWWYDTINKRLYLWPVTPINPASQNLEISHFGNGFDLHNRSYITLEGLNIEYFNENAINQVDWTTDRSYGNTLRNLNLRYANIGVDINQSVSVNESPSNVINGFTLEDSEVAYMDTLGVGLSQNWEGGSNPDLFTHSGVINTNIRNNDFHDLGFRSDNDTARGLGFEYADRLRFEGNHVHNIAHNGVQFSLSVIQSSKTSGFTPSEIKTGDILVKDNIFEEACLLGTDCGELKIWGSSPNSHVFRNFLITGNLFRNTFGWSYISEQRQRWMGDNGSQVKGMGGFGLFLDQVSGIVAYRNIAYNNAFYGYTIYGHWGDGDIVFVNNVAANSVYGMNLGGDDINGADPVNTKLLNNIFVNNENFGLYLNKVDGPYTNMAVDYNLYFNNGWRRSNQSGVMVIQVASWDEYSTMIDVQQNTPWEVHGLEGDPAFLSYDPSDHNLYDSSWPDFHISTANDYAIDRGTASLPATLTALLNEFGITDFQIGSAFDIGRYEAGFLILASPSTSRANPGDTVNFNLSLFPSDLPYNVNLSFVNPSPEYLTIDISQLNLSGTQNATISATIKQLDPLSTGEFFFIPMTGEGGGLTNTTNLGLLVGGIEISLPIVIR